LHTGHSCSPLRRGLPISTPHGHVGHGDLVVGQALQIGQ
jgi:hypothetical protein